MDSEKFVQAVIDNTDIYKELESKGFSEDVFKSLGESRNISFSKDEVETVCKYARALYDAGQYQGTLHKKFKVLESNKILNCVSGFAEDEEVALSISWGRFVRFHHLKLSLDHQYIDQRVR
jgi:hypothetical protein